MSFKQTFTKFFNNHSETRENHWDPKLQTHYFKTTKDKGFASVEHFFNRSSNFTLVAKSEEHGEISATYKGKGKKCFVIATIIMVKPFRTAVDLSITTESVLPFDLGFSHNLIPKVYEELKKEMPFIQNSSR